MGTYNLIIDLGTLQRGDIVRHKSTRQVFVVTGNYGDHVTAVASADMTNASEWEVFEVTK